MHRMHSKMLQAKQWISTCILVFLLFNYLHTVHKSMFICKYLSSFWTLKCENKLVKCSVFLLTAVFLVFSGCPFKCCLIGWMHRGQASLVLGKQCSFTMHLHMKGFILLLYHPRVLDHEYLTTHDVLCT